MGGSKARALAALGLAGALAVLAVPVGATTQPPKDKKRPVVEWVRVSPRVIDTFSAGRTISVTGRIRDEGSGLDDAAVDVLRGGVGGPGSQIVSLRRVSGSSFDGVFRATVRIRRFWPKGKWPIELRLFDKASNFTSVVTHFTQVGTGDDEGPTISEASFSPSSVDTSESVQDVTLRFTASDEIAGFGDPADIGRLISAEVVFARGGYPLSLDGFQAVGGEPVVVGGDAHNPVVQVVFHMPRYSAQGAWMPFVSINDLAGNSGGGPALFGQTFEQSGPGDDEGPTITPQPLSKTTFRSGEKVNLTVEVADAPAGLSALYFLLVDRTPISQGSCTRVSGDAGAGTYECSLKATGSGGLLLTAEDTLQNHSYGYPGSVKVTR